MKDDDKPIANPFVMLREEFDDWAVLFDPDTSHGFGTNPTGVYVWKLLDGEHAIDELLEKLRDRAEDVPEDAREHIGVFVNALVAEGLAAHSDSGSYRERFPHASLTSLTEVTPFRYEPPKLVNLNSGQSALGTTCSSHGSAGGSCTGGSAATTCCETGACVDVPCCGCGACHWNYCGYNCDNGDCPHYFCKTGVSAYNWCHTGYGTNYGPCESGSGPQ